MIEMKVILTQDVKGSGKKGAGFDEKKDCAGKYSPARQAGRLLG